MQFLEILSSVELGQFSLGRSQFIYVHTGSYAHYTAVGINIVSIDMVKYTNPIASTQVFCYLL